MRRAVILLSVFGLMASTLTSVVALAQSPEDELQRKVVTVLKAHEYKPSKKLWKRWGEEKVNDILAQMALDIRVAPSLRKRAIMSLSQLPSGRTKSTLGALISNEKTSLGLRRQALYSLAYAYPKRALPEVERHLVSGPKHLREAAAHAMALIDDIRVYTLLKERLSTEQALVVRKAIDRTLMIRKKGVQHRPGTNANPSQHPLTPDKRDKL